MCLGAQFARDADVTPFVRVHVEAQLSQARALDLRERAESQIWIAIENVAVDRGLPLRLANALWDAFFGREVVAGYYRELAGVSAPTATNDLASATAARLLRAEGERRGRRYLAGRELLGEVATALGLEFDAHDAAPSEARVAMARAITERLTVADQSPPATLVMGAWRELEREVEDAARRSGIERTRHPVAALTALLESAALIDGETAREVTRLGELRNRVVHAEGLPINAESAFAFVRQAQQLILVLNRAP